VTGLIQIELNHGRDLGTPSFFFHWDSFYTHLIVVPARVESMQQHRPFSIATWCLYLLLLAVRVFVAISPGYIHPDEFFQSAEITAGTGGYY
jgi:hypothetical protein